MRVSIIAEDDAIVIDGKAMTVDCEPLRANGISAIQWYDVYGEIEFERHHKPNEMFDSLEEFQSLVTAAKPIPSPKPPTPKELDEINNRFLLEHPDARKAWEEHDAEVKRRFDEAERRNPLPLTNDNARPQPQPPQQPTQAKQEKTKPKPKKK